MLSLIKEVFGFMPEPSAVGSIVNGVWNQVFSLMKEVVVPLATATFAGSFVYFTWLGSERDRLDKAKKMMIGSVVALLIVYAAPKIIELFVTIITEATK